MEAGKLQPPFDVVHVDTHSDLAFGPSGNGFCAQGRADPQSQGARERLEAYREGKKLDEANYLLFALAFRWMSRLAYVRNPKSHQDIPARLLDDGGKHSAAEAIFPC